MYPPSIEMRYPKPYKYFAKGKSAHSGKIGKPQNQWSLFK